MSAIATASMTAAFSVAFWICVGTVASQPPVSTKQQTVKVKDVTMNGDGVVSGALANSSTATVSDVRLRINYVWHWEDERNPGADSPGRIESYTVPDSIPSGGSVAFTYQPKSPLPERADGRFDVSVDVGGFTATQKK